MVKSGSEKARAGAVIGVFHTSVCELLCNKPSHEDRREMSPSAGGGWKAAALKSAQSILLLMRLSLMELEKG